MPAWLRPLFPACRRTPRPTRHPRPAVQELEPRDVPATFVVAAPAGNGPGSLADMIGRANANPGPDAIVFDPSVTVVTPAAGGLPGITDAVTLDGGGRVTIDGSGAGPVNGLNIFASGTAVRGLTIHSFRWNGIYVQDASGVTVQGCTVGTDGAVPRPNENGVVFGPGVTLGLIGTDGDGVNDAGEANTISGNAWQGVTLWGTGNTGNRVSGNRIGTNPAGTGAIPNHLGVGVASPTNFVGTDGDGSPGDGAEGNLISGNVWVGVWLTTNTANVATGTVIAGNRIGTNAAGDGPLPNDYGVYAHAGAGPARIGTDGNGTADAAERNVVSGNRYHGVIFDGGGAGSLIAGNSIGTDAAGTAAIGNGLDGLNLKDTSALRITGNVLSGNGEDGVYFVAGVTGSTVERNRIGTNDAGTAALPNGRVGVHVRFGSADNLIGGTRGGGNVISGNGDSAPGEKAGVYVADAGTTRNRVSGNRIGTNAEGTAAVPNRVYGVYVGQGASDTAVGTDLDGVADELEGNVISGSTGDGVSIQYGAARTLVAGNRIGTDPTGAAAVGPNLGNGVTVYLSSATTVGGASDAARNVVASSGRNGIVVAASTGTVIQGNRIGTDLAGAQGLGNALAGVWVYGGSRDTLVGGAGAGNVIAGNRQYAGVYVADAGTAGTRVAGNVIGANAAGTAAVPNAGPGVFVGGGAGPTVVGSDGDGVADEVEGNVISGNAGPGVSVDGAAAPTRIAGNRIGTNAAGAASLGTQATGVAVARAADVVVTGNTISGNTVDGVWLVTDALRTVVTRNRIGTDSGGGFAVPNGRIGVHIRAGSAGTVVGGTTADGNVISGNGAAAGVYVSDPRTAGTRVSGNRIGTNAGGTQAIPNAGHGVSVSDSATDTVIGTDGDADEGNVISGNRQNGVQVSGAGTDGTRVSGNRIGTNAAGTAAVPNGTAGVTTSGHGVFIQGGAKGTVIGTDGDGRSDGLERNIVSGNASTGVVLGGAGTDRNRVAGNVIGLNAAGTAPVGNAAHGVQVQNGASANTIGTDGDGRGDADEGNTISGNARAGVRVLDGTSATSARNAIRGNRIYANPGGAGTGLGIDLAGNGVSLNDAGDADFGPNGLQNYPVGLSATAGPRTAVRGTLHSAPHTLFTLDFYASAAADPTGYGEGERYLGSIVVLTDGEGNASFDASLAAATAAGEVVTATATDPLGNTSEFGPASPPAADPRVELSGRVFDDRDNDGAVNGPDAGLPGVPVTLYDAAGVAVAAATTGPDGVYSFAGRYPAGTYRIAVARPAGLLDGKETAGTLGGTVDNGRDADAIAGIVLHGGDVGTGYDFAVIRPSRVQALAWVDFNDDGEVNFGERAVAGVVVTLTGTDDRGNPVRLPLATDGQGIVEFVGLRPGTYTLVETQPAGLADGKDVPGTVNGGPAGGPAGNDRFDVALPAPGSDAVNFNFGERPAAGDSVGAGQTASIGFWQNRHGQALIRSLNGGPDATRLGDWLAATFPNVYGAAAGAGDLTGRTNDQVADLFTALFKRSGQAAPGGPPKLDAQVLAAALAVYVTNEALAGATAAGYGFAVTADGVGTATVDVGAGGAAFGVADGARVSVLDLLLAADARTSAGVLCDLDGSGTISAAERALRAAAYDVFAAVNDLGAP